MKSLLVVKYLLSAQAVRVVHDRATETDLFQTKEQGAKIVVGGEPLHLTWSDEFNEARGKRDFSYGKDDKWEGIDLWYKGTWDDEMYKPELAQLGGGKLSIHLEDTPAWDRQNKRMHKFTSAMLQSWNKVCLTGGYFEVRLKLPGTIEQGGVWGAAWLAGNLGRPGQMKSSEMLWPYSYDQCDQGVKAQRGLDSGTELDGQKITACDKNPGSGFRPNQGRGMPEIDLIESFVPTFGNDKNMRAHFTTSLQMGPLIPIDVNHGPGLTGCKGDPRHVHLYENCPGFTYFHNHTEKVEPNKWCQAVEGNMRGNTVQDCLSAEVDLRATHFEKFHTYGLLWEPKKRVVWYMDGEPLFEAGQEALSPKRSPSNPEFYVGQRDVPTEPMSMLLNVAISDHGVMNWNRHMTFPITMEVDYVRVYQNPAKGHTLSCDPKSHPTKVYIDANPSKFGLPICGNSKCDDGECTSCPKDCSGNMACPGKHLDEIPVWGDNKWLPGPKHGVGSEHGCEVKFTQWGIKIKSTWHACTVRRGGLLPHGPLEETKNKKFAILVETEGTGKFHYAATIGPGGNKCNPKKRGCPATYITVAEKNVALCHDCEGEFPAGGQAGASFKIDLSYRFPYFVGAWGAELRLVVQPGSDILIKHVKFGTFSVPQKAHKPLRILPKGYWEPTPCERPVGPKKATCGSNMLWLMSPTGGSKEYQAAHAKVSAEFKECSECTLPHDPCERPVCEWKGQQGCSTCADRMLWLSHKERRWKRLRAEESQEFIAQLYPRICKECKEPKHPCQKIVGKAGLTCAKAMARQVKQGLSRADAQRKVASNHKK